MESYNITGKILKILVYVLIIATSAFLIVPIIFSILGSFQHIGDRLCSAGG